MNTRVALMDSLFEVLNKASEQDLSELYQAAEAFKDANPETARRPGFIRDFLAAVSESYGLLTEEHQPNESGFSINPVKS